MLIVCAICGKPFESYKGSMGNFVRHYKNKHYRCLNGVIKHHPRFKHEEGGVTHV